MYLLIALNFAIHRHILFNMETSPVKAHEWQNRLNQTKATLLSARQCHFYHRCSGQRRHTAKFYPGVAHSQLYYSKVTSFGVKGTRDHIPEPEPSECHRTL